MEKYFGNYLGIVIQNNDPEKRGRVKVFIPHLSANIYNNWYNVNEDKSFETLFDSDTSKVNNILNTLKDTLPWAECASPIVGEVGNHYYDAYRKEVNDGDDITRKENKPSANINQTDAYNESYTVESYSNASKGLFSLPRVGSRVWCFFEAGDLQHPVYFATAYSEGDWNSINKNDNYPENYENYTERENPTYDGTYKNKLVISQRGGTIEITNTDNKESINISHYNGSFKIWSNDKNKEYVVNDDYKLVDGNKFVTVKGNNNITVEDNFIINVSDQYTLTVENGKISIEAQNNDIDIKANNINIIGTVNQSGGNVNVNDDVIADGISLRTHIHGGVESGGAFTDVPS